MQKSFFSCPTHKTLKHNLTLFEIFFYYDITWPRFEKKYLIEKKSDKKKKKKVSLETISRY